MNLSEQLLGTVSEAEMDDRSKKAAKDLKNLLNSFKNYGHQLELLGSSDELMKIDDARDALKAMIKKGM